MRWHEIGWCLCDIRARQIADSGRQLSGRQRGGSNPKLKEEGFEDPVATPRGAKAITMLREHKPDIVLPDIKMPDISGLELLRMMRRDREMMMIPAIVLTAANDPQVKLQALRLGASDFLAKPVDPSELTLRLENVMAVKAYQDHLADYSEKLEQQVRIRAEELIHSRQEAIH